MAIIGPNGSGKTNLLEAIYYLEVFRSFRGVNDTELVRFGEDVFRIEAEREGDEGSVAAAYDRGRRMKKVEVDGLEVERLSAAIGTLGVAVLRLEDAEIVRGGPRERRRFLDVALSLTEPAYLATLQRYRSFLSQRNEALRERAGRSELAAWSEGLVEAGARITAARARWCTEGRDRFRRYHEIISDGEVADLYYAASIARGSSRDGTSGTAEVEPAAESGPTADPEPAPEPWADRFREALAATAERERRRGVTVVGPHRDDLKLAIEGGGRRRDLRRFGSSGQQRTAALALRLLESDRLRERLGREPVYLLDDVFAELDEGRSARLLALFESGREGQVILTAPKASDVLLRGGDLERWTIEDGRLRP